MPKAPVPEQFESLLTSKALGHLATVSPSGKPQVNPVWFIWDDGRVLLSVQPVTAKYRNMRANPQVAISISDPNRPGSYLELRGIVVEFERFDTIAWVNQLARKYTGADFTGGHDGEERYKVTIQVEAWTGEA